MEWMFFSEHVHWILHGLLAVSVWNLNNSIVFLEVFSDDVHWILLIFLKLSMGFCMVF